MTEIMIFFTREDKGFMSHIDLVPKVMPLKLFLEFFFSLDVVFAQVDSPARNFTFHENINGSWVVTFVELKF